MVKALVAVAAGGGLAAVDRTEGDHPGGYGVGQVAVVLEYILGECELVRLEGWGCVGGARGSAAEEADGVGELEVV